MPVITCIEDLKRLHQRRTPKMFWDYCESGSYTEQTFRENSSDFGLIRLRQKVARDLSDRDVSGTMLGERVTMPVALAPVGSTGMQHPDGEILAARAAARFGVPFTLSTMSICSIEDVAAHSPAPFWFQLYVMRDEDFVDAIIERAKKAKCSALVLTLDLQVLGQRHKDLKNGLSSPPKPTLMNLLNIATKPRWALGMAKNAAPPVPQHRGPCEGRDRSGRPDRLDERTVRPQAGLVQGHPHPRPVGRQADPEGVLDAEDAQMAVDAGADAIVVSNHGGRQLDGALSSIRVLPSVVRRWAARPRSGWTAASAAARTC